MKNVLHILLVIVIASCQSQKIVRITSTCKTSSHEVFSKLLGVLIKENMEIKHSDLNLGYLLASAPPDYNMFVWSVTKKIWIISFRNDTMTAYAKANVISYDSFGNPTGRTTIYFSDFTGSNETWYWSVRNELEVLCGNLKLSPENVEYSESSEMLEE